MPNAGLSFSRLANLDILPSEDLGTPSGIEVNSPRHRKFLVIKGMFAGSGTVNGDVRICCQRMTSTWQTCASETHYQHSLRNQNFSVLLVNPRPFDKATFSPSTV